MNTNCCTPPTTERPQTESAPQAVLRRKPRYHVDRSDEVISVVVELPGVPKDRVAVRVDDQTLTVTAECKAATPDSWNPLHRELSAAGYELSLRLDSKVDDARLTAQLADGLLTLTLPIRETAKPREIAIQ